MKSLIKKIKKKINKLTGFWCAEDHLLALQNYRLYELKVALQKLKLNYDNKYNILDFGYGDGFQANYFKNKKFNVSAIDIENRQDLVDKNIDYLIYDGKKIPFENNKFDIIFSSNVLEHLENLDEIQKEFFRVLKDDGICIHILPSSSWRFWTIISSIVKYWYLDPRPHGDVVSNCFKELFFFLEECGQITLKKTIFKLKIYYKQIYFTQEIICLD